MKTSVVILLCVSGLLIPEFVASAQTWGSIGPAGDGGTGNFETVIGRVRSIDIRPVGNDYYVYAGASSGGVWRTKGSTGPVWKNLGDRLDNPAIGALAVHPNNVDVIIVGTGDPGRYPGGGMFWTDDAGQKWNPVALPVSPGAFFRLLYLPGNPSILLAASDAGLLRTSGGPTGTWDIVLSGLVTDLAINPANPNIQYCCRQKLPSNAGGVYKSTDAGLTWTLATPDSLSDRFGNGRLAICRDVPGTVAFVYEFNKDINGIGKSTDGGTTWTMFPTLPPQRGEADHALSIAIRPTDPGEIYVGAQGLYLTTLNGLNWFDLRSVSRHDDHTQLYFSQVTGDTILWICSDGGIYRYHVAAVASESWNGDRIDGLRIAQIDDIDVRSGSFRVVGLQDDGAMASNSAGSGWKVFGCCDVRNVAITDPAAPTFWTNTVGSTVTKYPSSGGSNSVGDPTGSLGLLFYDRFGDRVLSMRGNAIVSRPATATTPDVWKTEASISRPIGWFAGSRLNTGTVFASYADTLVVLQWNGSNWIVERTVKLFDTISCIYPSTERPGECWAGLSGPVNSPKILHTTDKWQSWLDVSGSLAAQPRIWSIAVRPFEAREVYAAVDDGVYRTTDGGRTWGRFQEGLPKVHCRRLKFVNDWHTGGGQLFVGTFGHSMYECPIVMPPTVYVDGSRLFIGGHGTFETPFGNLSIGIDNTPASGVLALRGGGYGISVELKKPMTINAYESTVTLRAP